MEFKFRRKHYKLERTAHCFALSKLVSVKRMHKTTKEIQDLIEETDNRYFTNLTNVVQYLFNEHVLDKNNATSILDKITKVNKDLIKLLSIDLKELL